MGRRRRRGCGTEPYLIAFGLGFLAYLVLPARFVVALLVIALIVSVLYCGK